LLAGRAPAGGPAWRAGHNKVVATDPDIRMLASDVVYADPWVRLRRDEIERRDGSKGTYAVIDRADFALVIPAENDGFHLVEEYRYPLGRRGWSFPQGGFPHGECGAPDELAALELAQETGLRAGKLTSLGYLATAHGMASQYGYYFLATELTAGPPDRELEEQDMRYAWVDRAEFEAMTRDGRIVDDSTLAAYALLMIAERRGDVRL
jgi:8-oxo-dGTP pyrophosphatase MutT (NUDIX family)